MDIYDIFLDILLKPPQPFIFDYLHIIWDPLVVTSFKKM